MAIFFIIIDIIDLFIFENFFSSLVDAESGQPKNDLTLSLFITAGYIYYIRINLKKKIRLKKKYGNFNINIKSTKDQTRNCYKQQTTTASNSALTNDYDDEHWKPRKKYEEYVNKDDDVVDDDDADDDNDEEKFSSKLK